MISEDSITPIIPEIRALAKEYSLDQVGIAELKTPLTIEFYKTWLQQSYHGSMNYLAEHLEFKENPQSFSAKAKTAIVVTKAYFPHPRPLATMSATRTALYAHGEDYHHWLKADLKNFCEQLKSHFPTEDFMAFTDSSPVLERDLAHQAGLGWFGKNTCLIHPKKGSLFFIGEIYTTMSLAQLTGSRPTATSEPKETSVNSATSSETLFQPFFQAQPLPDFCGKCTRCLDVCPTQALVQPRVLDATRCISYLTIEAKTIPPPELREKIGDWFFGCDLCQTVCPWNEKIFKNQLQTQKTLTETPTSRGILIQELKELLTLSGKQLQKRFVGTALARAGAFGIRRNAIVVATNRGLSELLPEIKALHQDKRLVELVEWSSFKLTTLSDHSENAE